MKENLTKHGEMRMTKRNGLPKKSTGRICSRVLELGIRRMDTKGRLRKYLDRKWHDYGETAEYIIYGQNVYVFSEDKKLITMFPVPSNLVKDCKKMLK